MAQNEIAAAARAICEEKGISLESVVETIEAALAAAYRKDFGEKNQNIKVDFELETATSKVYDEKTVVEDMPEEETEDSEGADAKEEKKSEKDDKKVESSPRLALRGRDKKLKVESTTTDDDKKDGKVIGEESEGEEEEERKFNPRTEIQLSDAKAIKKNYKIGDVIRTDLEIPDEYGRMAAQTAKQVIIQRLREVERANLFEEFKDKKSEVVTGVVQRREGRVVLIDLGRATGILTSEGQVPGERYESGQRIKVYVEDVRMGNKGPEIILSRTSEEIVRQIFFTEIPEIANGLIEVKSVSREAGSRSKIAIHTLEENVDPIGSCVGQRGTRIQTIIAELGGEKVDIIEYSEDPTIYISNSLAPAKVSSVEIKEDEKLATAMVASDQLSLAIGKGGQNVRLAAKLTGWKIDIKEVSGVSEVRKSQSQKATKSDDDNEVESLKSKVESETTNEVLDKKKEEKDDKPKKEKKEKDPKEKKEKEEKKEDDKTEVKEEKKIKKEKNKTKEEKPKKEKK